MQAIIITMLILTTWFSIKMIMEHQDIKKEYQRRRAYYMQTGKRLKRK